MRFNVFMFVTVVLFLQGTHHTIKGLHFACKYRVSVALKAVPGSEAVAWVMTPTCSSISIRGKALACNTKGTINLTHVYCLLSLILYYYILTDNNKKKLSCEAALYINICNYIKKRKSENVNKLFKSTNNMKIIFERILFFFCVRAPPSRQKGGTSARTADCRFSSTQWNIAFNISLEDVPACTRSRSSGGLSVHLDSAI